MSKNAKIGAAVAVVAVAVVVVVLIVTSSDDEAPIRVRNGSMTIDTDGTWQADGGAWSNETGKDHHNDLWVRVNLTNGTTCKGSGHPVHIEYSVNGFNAIFNVVGNPARTKVAPRNGLVFETNHRLRHGTQADGGYITGVRINGSLLTCDITQNNLDVINICSSASSADCQ
jgi:hypothetical protein